MTDKPTTNIIELGKQAELEPGSPASGEELSLTPGDSFFSPGPDGALRKMPRGQRIMDSGASIS